MCQLHILLRLVVSSLRRPSVSAERGSREREDGGVCVPRGAGGRAGDSQPQGDGPAAERRQAWTHTGEDESGTPARGVPSFNRF